MKKIVYACVMLLFGVGGCDIDQINVDNLSFPVINSTWTIPIGSSRYEILDLIEDITKNGGLIIEEDEFQTLIFIFEDSIPYTYPIDGSIAVDRTDTFDIEEKSIEIEFNKNFTGGTMEYETPAMKFYFNNSLTIPVAVWFREIYSVKTDSLTGEADTVYLTDTRGNPFPPFPIESPAMGSNSFVLDSIIFNQNNSNLRELLAPAPELFVAVVSGITNPNGPVPGTELNAGAQLNTNIEVQLPMKLSIKDLQVPLDFNVENEDISLDEADSFSIRIVTHNELPINATLGLQVLDAADSVLYEVDQTPVVVSAFLFPQEGYESREPKSSPPANIPISAAGIEAINSGSKIRILMILNSPPTSNSTEIYAPILSRYTITIELGIAANLNIEL